MSFSLFSFAQEVESISIPIGRGQYQIDFGTSIDLSILVKDGVVNPETNQIDWDKLYKMNNVKVSSNGGDSESLPLASIDRSASEIGSFLTNDGFLSGDDVYSKLKSSAGPACKKSLFEFSKAIEGQTATDIVLVDPNEGCSYTISDDDGVASLSALYMSIRNEKISNKTTDSPKINGLNKYSALLADSINRFKLYYQYEYSQKDTPDFIDVDMDTEKSYLDSLEPFVVEMSKKGSISQSDFNKLGAALEKVADTRYYNRTRRCEDGSERTDNKKFTSIFSGIESSMAPIYSLNKNSESCGLIVDSSKLSYLEHRGINKVIGTSTGVNE